jgi:septal ring factor EnvC (AmiA/AmiB activator)
VATHPQREKIVRDLINARGSLQAIANRYSISKKAVWNYMKDVLTIQAKAAEKERGLRTAEGLMAKLESEIEKMEKLDDSITLYLRDPDDPTRFTNDVQADDVLIVYSDYDPDDETGKRFTRRRGMLSELLKTAMRGRPDRPFDIQIKREDSRRLFIDVHRAIGDELDRLAKILGLIKDVRIQISRTEVWSFVMGDIIKALEKFPDAKEALTVFWEKKALEIPEDAV